MVPRKSSIIDYFDPSDKWMAKLCIEPSMDSKNCALAVFCPCILVGKIRWRIKQRELNLDPLQSAWHRKYSCNSSCCSSIFCLCPWYVNKFHPNIRSLYAISGKKNSKFKNCICCTCILLQLDREIRAREGETRLRTNQNYSIDPVLTQPEISLPMKYISPFEAKARSNYESSPAGTETIKIRRFPNPTKRFASEKVLERRLFILRDVYSHGGLALETPFEGELKLQNRCHSERFDQELLAPLHWKIELTQCGGNSSNKYYSVNPSFEYHSMLLTGKDRKVKRFLSPQLALTDSIDIVNSVENLPYSRIISSSNTSNTNSLESSEIYNSVEDQAESFTPNSLGNELSFRRDKNFDCNSGIAPNKPNREHYDIKKIMLGKLIEGNHSTDLIDTSAVANFNVKEGSFRNQNLPNSFSELNNSCLSQVYSTPRIINNESHKNQSNFIEYKEKPEKLKFMSYRTISSATVVDIPKSRSQRKSRDKVFATLASGVENLSLNNRSVTKRPKWHSSTFVAPYQTSYSTQITVANSMERRNLQVLPLDTGKSNEMHHLKPYRFEQILRQESGDFSTSLSGNSQKVRPETFDHQEILLNHLSKLPICINREIGRNHPSNRPRLSPILSNENIYRQRERETKFLSYPNQVGKRKEKKDDYDKYPLSNSLYPENSTNRDGTIILSPSLKTGYVRSIPRSKLVSVYDNAETNLSSKIKENSKDNDQDKDIDIATRGQAAQRALRLILVRSPSGVTD